jgi:hypothetical protein
MLEGSPVGGESQEGCDSCSSGTKHSNVSEKNTSSGELKIVKEMPHDESRIDGYS